MSIVKNLSLTTLSTLNSIVGLKEVGSEQEPFKVLRSPMGPQPVGQARLFHGKGGETLVYIGLTVPMIAMDSHMLFCFTPAASPVPHFTLDAVHAGGHYAFHLDLIPKVDLAVNLPYMRDVYLPLTAAHDEVKALPGLTPAHLSPMQLGVMSPWMLAHRATEEAMDSIGMASSKYLAHWATLHQDGLAAHAAALGAQPAQRDLAHRHVLFNREVDPVWAQVDRLLGHDGSEELRLLLIGKDEAKAP